MAAPKGNQFWLARTSHGRNKLFESADTLWDACVEYFQWVEDNPLEEGKVFCSQGDLVEGSVSKMRAMTIDGLCLFLDIDTLTWRRWRDDDDFCTVTTKADSVIRSQKFAGAAAGLLNPVIIARDLGLVEKTNNEHTGKDGGPIQTITTDMTPEEATEAYSKMMNEE